MSAAARARHEGRPSERARWVRPLLLVKRIEVSIARPSEYFIHAVIQLSNNNNEWLDLFQHNISLARYATRRVHAIVARVAPQELAAYCDVDVTLRSRGRGAVAGVGCLGRCLGQDWTRHPSIGQRGCCSPANRSRWSLR